MKKREEFCHCDYLPVKHHPGWHDIQPPEQEKKDD